MNKPFEYQRKSTPRWLLPAVLSLGFLIGCGAKQSTETAVAPTSGQSTASAVPVEIAKPSPADQLNAISATGMLSASVELRLSFKTGGILKRILVKGGERVQAGQLLAELDLTEIDAGARQSRESLRKAKRDYERAALLFKQDVIAKAQLDDARTALDVARAANAATRFNAEVGRLSAQTDGVVLKQFVEAGEVIAPGAPVLALGQDDNKKILKVSLSDVDAVRVAIGDPARVRFDAFPGQEFVATVVTLAGSASAGTGLFEIELAIDGDLSRLSSGVIGQAKIQPKSASAQPSSAQGVLIPIAALVQANAEQGQVFVVEDQRAQARSVRLGAMVGTAIIVQEGLSVDDNVVVRGASYLDEGSLVLVNTAVASLRP